MCSASAHEYIEYNYGFVMLLTLYSVGTIVKCDAKDNTFMTLLGLICEQLPTVCVLKTMFFNLHYLQCT